MKQVNNQKKKKKKKKPKKIKLKGSGMLISGGVLS
jgi:hypothetical protein